MHGPENLKRSRQKKLVKSNKSISQKKFHGKYSVLSFFPVQKIDFWPFLKLQKMDFGQKKFVKLIYLIPRVFLAHYAHYAHLDLHPGMVKAVVPTEIVNKVTAKALFS